MIGTRIAIHGGQRYEAAARHSIAGINMRAYIQLAADPRRHQPGILGTVRLAGVVERRHGRLELVAGDWGEITRERCVPWFVGRYGWLVDQRQVLEVPIPCKGFQRFWSLPDEIAARLA